MSDLITLVIYDAGVLQEALEHYPGGKDHDQMKHGAWSPLSAHHKPQVHVKGAKKYNHLTIAAKQKLLGTLAGGAQAKAKAELVKTLGTHAASSGGGGSSGSSSMGKKTGTGTKKAATKKKAAAEPNPNEHQIVDLKSLGPLQGGGLSFGQAMHADTVRMNFHNDALKKMQAAKSKLTEEGYNKLIDSYNQYMSTHDTAQHWLNMENEGYNKTFMPKSIKSAKKLWPAPPGEKTASATPKATVKKAEPAPKVEPPKFEPVSSTKAADIFAKRAEMQAAVHDHPVLAKLEEAPAMTGNGDQAWATKIRGKFYEAASKQITDAEVHMNPVDHAKLVNAFNAHMAKQTDAQWWIDHKDTLKALVPNSAEHIEALSGLKSTHWQSADTEWKGSDFNQKSTEEKDVALSHQTTSEIKLSHAEKNAVASYSGSGYQTLNETGLDEQLRTGKEPSDQAQLKGLDSVLAKGHAPDDMAVYRGMGHSVWSAIQGKEGQMWTDKGFFSTSIDANKSFGGVKATIHVPKGSAGLYIRPLSYHSHELEWLMPRGSTFKIISTGTGGGQNWVVLELIPPDHAHTVAGDQAA